MKAHKLLLIFSLFLVVGIISCNKDNNTPTPQPSGTVLPAVITYIRSVSPGKTVTLVNKFEYDKQDRISKVEAELFDNGESRGFKTTLTFTYTSKYIATDLTRTDMELGNSRQTYYFQDSAIYYAEKLIRLDTNNHALSYHSYNNRTSYAFTYDQDGNAKNITIVTRPTQNTGQTNQTYTLTSGPYNGIFRNVKTPAWYITSQMGPGSIWDITFSLGELSYQHLKNNCIKSVETNEHIIYEYDYTYNSDHYPTQITRNPNFDGGEYVRYEIEYTPSL